MTALRLLWRSWRHYRRVHVGVMLCVLLATAILAGALALGDSAAYTLRTRALERLGQVQLAMDAGPRLVRATLASDISRTSGLHVVSVLQARGIAKTPTDRALANSVNVLGVPPGFWSLASQPCPPLEPGEVALGEPLAQRLGVRVNDYVVLVVPKPSPLPIESPLSDPRGARASMHLRVRAVLTPEQLGTFSLRPSATPALDAFVPLATMQQALGVGERANLLLFSESQDASEAQAALRAAWTLADAQLELRELGDGQLELRSQRVLLEEPVVRAAREASPQWSFGVLTWFVNELRAGERACPYSMVSAVERPAALTTLAPMHEAAQDFAVLGPPVADDEIVINQWLHDDLSATVGQTLGLKYFTAGPGRKLVEKSRSFRVARVVPMVRLAADAELMPAFPGLAHADTCRNWQSDLVDIKRVRPADEAYWNAYRGTPKAFVSPAAGRAMWGSSMGQYTAIRYGEGSRAAIEQAVLERLAPEDIGLTVAPVRAQAMASAVQSTDLGQLFLGLGGFLILAALLLLGMVLALTAASRAGQVGMLLAVGLSPARVRAIILAELMLPVGLGVAAGVRAGVEFAQVLLAALESTWSGAVASTAIELHVENSSMVWAATSALILSAGVTWLVVRRQLTRPARELLIAAAWGAAEEAGHGQDGRATHGRDADATMKRRHTTIKRPSATMVTACAVGLLAIGGFIWPSPVMWFLVGMMLLVTGLLVSRRLLRPGSSGALKLLPQLAWRNASRRPGQSFALVSLLACTTFLILAVGAYRQGPLEPGRRDSGTGGFTLMGESSLPIISEVIDASRPIAGASVVPMRLREGEDASCLNLGRPSQPRLLGVEPRPLAERGAFVFSKTSGGKGWDVLEQSLEGAVPAVADESTIRWSLHMRLGDELTYTDEHGKAVRVRLVGELAGSVLQGSVLISRRAFDEHFPSSGGYRFFLVDGQQPDHLAGELTSRWSSHGLALITTSQHLEQLQSVQNTYLSIFQLLGGLGLLLGAAGLGLVVARNIHDRRAELATLQAVGFTHRRLMALVLLEHAALLAWGLVLGVVCAAVALAPVLISGRQMPGGHLVMLIAIVGASGLVSTALAVLWGFHRSLVQSLRSE